jgi:hypothetical protein
MTPETLSDPRDTVAEHLKVLKGYANRNLVHGEELSEAEREDKTTGWSNSSRSEHRSG